MKKFLIILSALILCITPFFAIDNEINSVSAYDSVHNYNATISTDYSTAFLEGIDSVESVSFDYYTYNHYHYESVDFELDFLTTSPISDYHSPTSKFGIKLNINNEINYNSSNVCNTNLLFCGSFNFKLYSSSSGVYCYKLKGTLTDIYTTDLFLSVNNNVLPFANISYKASPRSYYTDDTNLSQYLDLNSETNYEYSFEDINTYAFENQEYNLYKYLNDKYYIDVEMFYSGELHNATSSYQIWTQNPNDSGNNKYSNISISSSTIDQYWFHFSSGSSVSYIESSLYISNFEVIVNRPATRLENSLVLYNYDYDAAISSVSSIEYSLSKDNDLYIAKYNGSLPNNRYIGIVSSELQNRIYDEYIYIDIGFKDNIVSINNYSFSLGFDFNFSRYYEPFVIQKSDLDNYNLPGLNKPNDWWDFGGWIRYAFIWILFYNPIISPISKFIVSIFGVFINVFKFILGFELGAFLLAFIGFMVLYSFFTSVVPFSPKKAFDNIPSLSDLEDRKYKKLSKQRYRENLDKYKADSDNLKKTQKELNKKSK